MSRQKATLNYRIHDNQAVLCAVIDGVDTGMLTLDEHATDAGIYLEGDKVIYAQKNGRPSIHSMSCQVLRLSRFRRNLNSLQRNLVNEHHPLNRVLVLNQKMLFWCIPHDQHLTHHYFQNVAKVTTVDSCPYQTVRN